MAGKNGPWWGWVLVVIACVAVALLFALLAISDTVGPLLTND